MTKIMITGGTSPLGQVLCNKLRTYQPGDSDGDTFYVDNCPHSPLFNCLNYSHVEDRMIEFAADGYIDLVISLAGYNGNIEFNRKYPADIFYQNTQMCLNIMDNARKYARRFLYVMPTCAFADKDMLTEQDLWDGISHNSVECHGLARRNYNAFARQLWKQYQFPCVGLAFNTIYGPTDHFDEKSKVLCAVVKKVVDAHRKQLPEITFWGNGVVQRGFIYVEDAADAIISYINCNEFMDVINMPSHEIYIHNLVKKVVDIVGYKGNIKWDTSKPNGQFRKMLDTSKNTTLKNFTMKWSLDDGIKETVEGYKNQWLISL